MKRIQRPVFISCLTVVLIALGVWYFTTRQSTTPAEHTTEEVTRVVPEGFKEYRSPLLNVSLLYPDYLLVRERRETATSYTVIFEDPETKAGFQVYVVSYEEQAVTEEQFRTDVPSGVRLNEKKVFVDGVTGVQFDSQDFAIGQTREVWFIHQGYLYEVTTYLPLGEWLSHEILRHWRFL